MIFDSYIERRVQELIALPTVLQIAYLTLVVQRGIPRYSTWEQATQDSQDGTKKLISCIEDCWFFAAQGKMTENFSFKHTISDLENITPDTEDDGHAAAAADICIAVTYLIEYIYDSSKVLYCKYIMDSVIISYDYPYPYFESVGKPCQNIFVQGWLETQLQQRVINILRRWRSEFITETELCTALSAEIAFDLTHN